MPMMPLYRADEDQGADYKLLQEYEHFLAGKAEGTIEAYLRTVRHIMGWVAVRPGNGGHFQPHQLTKTAVEMYLASLEQDGFSINHRARVKSTISSFARWLIEEKGLLQRNPTRGVDIPPQQALAPRQLSEDQRYILRSLVEQEGDRRGAALFALGYWAGCRVSDVSWLQMAHTHVGPKVGWLHVGYKGGKWRDIDLINEARKPLYEYLRASGEADRTYVFTSQRSDRLTEEGIHYWFRMLKAQATKDQWAYIHDLTFHDLRHDFAHRPLIEPPLVVRHPLVDIAGGPTADELLVARDPLPFGELHQHLIAQRLRAVFEQPCAGNRRERILPVCGAHVACTRERGQEFLGRAWVGAALGCHLVCWERAGGERLEYAELGGGHDGSRQHHGHKRVEHWSGDNARRQRDPLQDVLRNDAEFHGSTSS